MSEYEGSKEATESLPTEDDLEEVEGEIVDGITEERLEELLLDCVHGLVTDGMLGDVGYPAAGGLTFEEAGVMTYNRGIIVRPGDGSEFQVTIIRSR